MKKLFTIVAVVLPSMVFAQFSPYIPSSKSNPYYEDSVSLAKKRAEKQLRETKLAAGEFEYSGGTYLQKASGSIITGMLFQALGAGISYAGVKVYEADSDPNKKLSSVDPYYYAGGLLALAGVIFEVRGVILIGKAGKAFDAGGKSALYVEPRNNGAALVLRF